MNMKKPERSVDWLREHGWCIDNLRVGPSSIPSAGRGAFAKHELQKGDVVVPLPLQSFKTRDVFKTTKPEQLFVNYCLQPANSEMIFYPYGSVFNLVNHPPMDTTTGKRLKEPNVALRWAAESKVNHREWLNLTYDEFWKVVRPGYLILEVVALKEIAIGEEILLDYGKTWEQAWLQHVASWKPLPDADKYVYPAEIDETVPLRTVKEQEQEPYPSNLVTMCSVHDWARENGNHVVWRQPPRGWFGSDYRVVCHILDRSMGKNGNYVYTVSLDDMLDKEPLPDYTYDASVPIEDQYIDYQVPRRAIRFLEKPYADDEHQANVFRHPLEFPAELVPESWLREE